MKAIAIAIVGTLLVVAGLFLYGEASKRPGPMTRDDFTRSTQALASHARETALLLEHVEGDRLGKHYFDGHRATLAKEVAEEAEKLDDPPPPGLDEAGPRARALATELASLLKDLPRQVADRGALATAKAGAARIGQEASHLAPQP